MELVLTAAFPLDVIAIETFRRMINSEDDRRLFLQIKSDPRDSAFLLDIVSSPMDLEIIMRCFRTRDGLDTRWPVMFCCDGCFKYHLANNQCKGFKINSNPKPVGIDVVSYRNGKLLCKMCCGKDNAASFTLQGTQVETLVFLMELLGYEIDAA